MPSTGAPHCDGEVALSFVPVCRNQRFEQSLHAVEKVLGCRLRQDEVAHRIVETAQRTKRLVVVGIRDEPHVEHRVHVERKTVFEPERHDGDLQRVGKVFPGEQLHHLGLELRELQRRGVDHLVGNPAHGFQYVTLVLDRLRDGSGLGAERVLATRLRVALDQRLGRRLQEQNPHVVSGTTQPRHQLDGIDLLCCDTDHQCQP